ncbi:hypothetical protein C8J56DRAFT_1046179 [Mycena floridula]|nr:hypothetical protein C8J56DRAFT_1046179 [Mycena floridula]
MKFWPTFSFKSWLFGAKAPTEFPASEEEPFFATQFIPSVRLVHISEQIQHNMDCHGSKSRPPTFFVEKDWYDFTMTPHRGPPKYPIHAPANILPAVVTYHRDSWWIRAKIVIDQVSKAAVSRAQTMSTHSTHSRFIYDSSCSDDPVCLEEALPIPLPESATKTTVHCQSVVRPIQNLQSFLGDSTTFVEDMTIDFPTKYEILDVKGKVEEGDTVYAPLHYGNGTIGKVKGYVHGFLKVGVKWDNFSICDRNANYPTHHLISPNMYATTIWQRFRS